MVNNVDSDIKSLEIKLEKLKQIKVLEELVSNIKIKQVNLDTSLMKNWLNKYYNVESLKKKVAQSSYLLENKLISEQEYKYIHNELCKYHYVNYRGMRNRLGCPVPDEINEFKTDLTYEEIKKKRCEIFNTYRVDTFNNLDVIYCNSNRKDPLNDYDYITCRSTLFMKDFIEEIYNLFLSQENRINHLETTLKQLIK